MFTVPTIVTSDNLSKRSYVTFYFNNVRIREYNGNNLNIRLNPNRAKSFTERQQLLTKLQFELHKALEASEYPASQFNKDIQSFQPNNAPTKTLTALQLLFEAVKRKIKSDLSRTYKRDLKNIYRQFRDFMSPQERAGKIIDIPRDRVEQFLAQFGSSGTYYMNKRRNLSVLFASAGNQIDKSLKAVKETSRRKAKAKLHKAYDREQLKPILEYLKMHYPKLYICCLLTYGSWLRPHEEVRLLTKDNFKKTLTEIHLSGSENKGGRVRVVYIPDYVRTELEPILLSLDRKHNIISLHPEPYNESYFNTQWSRAWKKMFALGLIYEDQTIYSFRHTAAIDLYRRTKDVYLLQKLLGHSSILVTLKYLRNLGELNSDDLRDAAPRL